MLYFYHLSIIFAGWLIMFGAYLGWGVLLGNILKLEVKGKEKIFILVWLGWSFSILVFNILNIFLPLTYYLSLLFFVTGIIFFIYFYKNVLSYQRFKVIHGYFYIFFIFFAFIAVLAASRSMLAPTVYDSGLYHFNSIRWLNECAIVPGLGNLHGRLAFNQTFFTYVASLNLYPYFGQGHNLANSFLLILLIGQCLTNAFNIIYKFKNKFELISPYDIATLFYLPVLLFIMFNAGLSSPNPDIASTLIQLLIFLCYLHFLRTSIEYSQDHTYVGIIIVLAATAVTLKLSNVFFIGSIILIIVVLHFLKGVKASRVIIYSVILASIIMIIWSYRGVISSGYIAYPSTIGRINTDWAMSKESVRHEAEWIYSWARQPGASKDIVLSNWNWLYSWVKRVFFNISGIIYIAYPSFIAFFILLASITIQKKYRTLFRQKKQLMSLLFIAPAFIALLLWFLIAPGFRFANALFFILPISSFLYFNDIYETVFQKRICHKLFILFFFIINAHFGYWFVISNGLLNDGVLKGFQPIKTVELIQEKTNSGLIVLVPLGEGKAWDSPLPSTPYFNPDLKLKGDNFCEGFIIDNR